MFSKLFQGLRGKMLSLLVFPIVSILTISVFSFFGINKLIDDLSVANGDLIPGFRSFHKMSYYTGNLNQNILLGLQSTNKEERAEFKKNALISFDLLKKEIVEFDEKHELNDEEKKIYVPILEGRETYYKALSSLIENLENNDQVKSNESISLMKEKLLPYSASMMTYLDGLSDGHKVEADELYESAESKSQLYRFISICAALGGIALSVFLSLLISRKFILEMTKNVTALSSTTLTVNSAAESIAQTSHMLKTTSSEQTRAILETTTAMEEISSMVQKNAETASSTAMLSKDSQKSAIRGKEVVEEMKEAIRLIADDNSRVVHTVNESNNHMTEIASLIADIGAKTKIINEIVFQTKLLSFNASVEAARAGDQGKGFAVVAEEVGNLAQMSGNAAQEISSILDNSIQKVNDIVNSSRSQVSSLVTESKKKIDIGVRVAEECDVVLTEIVENVNQVTTMANEIAVSSREQAKGVNEINMAINQLDQMNQQNSEASDSSSANSELLEEQVKSLKSIVSELAQNVNGEVG